jgi:hypothetical protein
VTLFDQVIRRTEDWLERQDRDRDAMMRARAATGPNARLDEDIDRLEAERADTAALIEALRKLRHRPELLLQIRPRMAQFKGALRRARARKGESNDGRRRA